MVDTAKLEAEAKAVAAEVESAASGLLGALWPRWEKFKATWRSDTMRKKVITAVLIVAAGGFAWYFGLGVGRLALGSYRSAYAYGHDDYVTRVEVKAEKDNILATALASAPTNAQFRDLEAKVQDMEFRINALEKKPEPAQITTGSIAKKRKSAPVKSSASSWFDLP